MFAHISKVTHQKIWRSGYHQHVNNAETNEKNVTVGDHVKDARRILIFAFTLEILGTLGTIQKSSKLIKTKAYAQQALETKTKFKINLKVNRGQIRRWAGVVAGTRDGQNKM